MTPTQVFKGTVVVILVLTAAYIMLISRRIIMVLFIAIIIASAVRPLVESLVRVRIPRGIAILGIYITFLSTVLLLSAAVMPPILNQITQYVESDWRLSAQIIAAQRWVEHAISDVTNDEVSLVAPEEIRNAVSQFVGEIRRVMPTVLNDIGATLGDVILILVMGAYWLTAHERVTDSLAQLSNPRMREKANKMVNEIENTMGSYVRGIVTISTIIFFMNFAVFTLLNVPNALTLAFIIGVATTVPMVGGIIGGLMATFIALVSSPSNALIVFITFLVINQIENYVLSPRIMGDSVGLDPLVVIVYTSIGFVMFGITGALVAVPVMGTVHILLSHLVIEPYSDSVRAIDTEDGLPIIRDMGDEQNRPDSGVIQSPKPKPSES